MAVMLGNLYGALREAGVTEDRAQRAAEEVAVVNEVGDLKKDVAELKRDVTQVKTEVVKLQTDVAAVKGMLGFVLAFLVGGFGIVIRLLAH